MGDRDTHRTPNPYNTGNSFISAGDILRHGALQRVHHKLLLFAQKLFVAPRLKYDQQVIDNEISNRIKKAANSMEMTATADKIATAIATESVPDPKIVRVRMIKDAVDLKFKEAAAAKKKTSKQPQQQ